MATPTLRTQDQTFTSQGSKTRTMKLMEEARASATFDPRQLTYFLWGGEDTVEAREAAFARVEKALGLTDTSKLPPIYGSQSREDAYLYGLMFGKVLLDEERQHGHGFFDVYTHRYDLIIASPFGHNPLMFGATLRLQSSPEQCAHWLPMMEEGRLIGTYAQTEIGHGTFLRGLETTTTFDHKNDEFVIHSPTLTSAKYWPSALGFTATHAIVTAKMIIPSSDEGQSNATNHGVHPFLVPIRSLTTGANLPGIETGDIGLKMAFNTTDMGYATFTHVRIPRTNMLMGNAQVHRDGSYTKSQHAKLAYSTMLYTRTLIAQTVAYQLAQAVVIASRFSVVREQGVGMESDAERGREWPIINYQSQKYRILSLMAQAYALDFAAKTCNNLYQEILARQKEGDHSTLPYGHAITAALKAYATQVAFDGAEDARKCCGGYGYSVLSGFPAIVGTLAPMPTLEGENWVMYQQTARYLMKAATVVLENKSEGLHEGVRYVASPRQLACPLKGNEFLDADKQVENQLDKAQKEEGLTYAEAWNKTMLPLVFAARAHIELFVLQSFITHTKTCPDPPSAATLHNLRSLFALTAIESPASISASSFVEDGYLSFSQVEDVRELVHGLLDKLLPEIVGLGDGWNFSDASLGSALGCRDGNFYERVMGWTRQLPMNVKAREEGGVQRSGWERWVGPMVKGKL